MEADKKKWDIATVVKGARYEIQISVLRLFRPMYSLQICEIGGNRFLRIATSGQGKIEVAPIDTAELVELVQRAETWILSDRQAREDEIVEERAKRDMRDATPQGPAPRRTGKTERKRERDRDRRRGDKWA